MWFVRIETSGSECVHTLYMVILSTALHSSSANI